MINIKHEALKRYTLLAGFLGLLLAPLMVVLFLEQRCPPDRGSTVNLPRYVKNADQIAFYCYEEERRILISLPEDEATYLGHYRLTGDDLVDGIIKAKTTRPADARIVYLKAGVGVSYGSVVDTLQSIRAASVDRVGLVVNNRGADGGSDNAGFLEVRLYQ